MKTKKLFLGMLAVAGMLFATSCSQEEPVVAPVDGEFVNATFTLGAADAMGTRANIGQGLSANTVDCAVYDANGVEMRELRQSVAVTDKKATYNVRLAKGQDYRVAFFAYNAAGNHYDLTDLKSIKINAAYSNVETRDAFTNYIDIKADDLTNKSNIEETVTLKRPFAQLNLGIDDTELADAANAGVEISKSKITVSNVYNAFNAFANTVAADATLGSMTFEMNAIPTEALTVVDKDGNPNQYTYLALNYLLVGDLTQEKSLTDVEFTWENEDGSKTNTPTTHFINIPVQRNFRTNILGKLLTTPAEFNIVIDANFDGEYTENVETVISKTVTTADELVAAVNNAAPGQTIIRLANDITATAFELDQQAGAQIYIDGQGHKVDAKIIVDGNNRWTGVEMMSFENINFDYTGSAAEILAIATNDASTGNSYAHNVVVNNCTFKGHDAATAIRANQAFDLRIANCEAEGLHSFSQISSSVGVTIDRVISNCVRGIHVDARNAIVTKCNITTTGSEKYGIRHDVGNANDGLKIVDCSINAAFPVVVRNTQHKSTVETYTLTFEGNNVLAGQLGYHVAIGQEEYDTVGEDPTRLSGTVTVNGADAAWSIFK